MKLLQNHSSRRRRLRPRLRLATTNLRTTQWVKRAQRLGIFPGTMHDEDENARYPSPVPNRLCGFRVPGPDWCGTLSFGAFITRMHHAAAATGQLSNSIPCPGSDPARPGHLSFKHSKNQKHFSIPSIWGGMIRKLNSLTTLSCCDHMIYCNAIAVIQAATESPPAPHVIMAQNSKQVAYEGDSRPRVIEVRQDG
jgi:hypothetical protein